MFRIWLSVCLCFFSIGAFAQGIWQDVITDDLGLEDQRQIFPNSYRTMQVNLDQLQVLLDQAPEEDLDTPVEFSLPTPDGGTQLFAIQQVPVMAPELAARYPSIRTFQGVGLSEPGARIRFDLTPQGFHAMVTSKLGTWYMDPYAPGVPEYVMSYYRSNLDNPHDFICEFQEEVGIDKEQIQDITDGSVGSIEGELLEYRVAIAATGEYTIFHGGTVETGLAAIVTALNRVNEVYERDVAIRMILIPNNDTIIYTSPGSDPYTNNSGFALLGENQSNLNNVIGAANYDIGHVFSTGGGGVATLNSPCVDSIKARGVTGLPSPTGDPFYIDFVAHEMGHQWGGTHSYNGTAGSCGGNRTQSTAFEPGSGTTIMGYAGICGSHNLANNSDAHFHPGSYDQMVFFSRSAAGATCADVNAVANTAPVVNAGMDYTIPAQTPFTMTGTAEDAEQVDLLYSWEQMDAGTASAPAVDTGDNAIFRSFDPTPNNWRHYPRIEDILSGTPTIGEHLPTTNRTIAMRLQVRDQNPGGGGVADDSAVVTVTNAAGPFLVTSFNSVEALTGGDMVNFTWDVAGTDAAPVSCALVDIFLSTDGGFTFDRTIATGLTNNGSAMVELPNEDLANVRFKIQCSDNIFFDITNAEVTITAALDCPAEYEVWNDDSTGFLDFNNNGIVDIIDLLNCMD